MVCIVNMWKKGRSSTKYYLLFPCFDFCAGQRAAAPSHVVTGAYLDVLSPLHPGSASSPPPPLRRAVQPQLLGAQIKWMVHPTQLGPLNN